MHMAVKAVPDGYHTLTPYLVCQGAADAIKFYEQAFGATETARMPGPGGSVMHAELRIGTSMLMLSDENPERGALSPKTVGGSPVSVFIYTEDVDALFARAVKAGAQGVAPPADMFWGDRFAQLVDPFGHSWAMATHKEDVSPEEMGRRMQAMG
ncbi:MAG: VOC family protein [Vicinamibacterales bacterium]